MRTANNTNNYTVEGLVAKYRNFVKKNTPHSIGDTWTRVDRNGNIQSGDVIGYADPIDASADQQLLAVLYKNYAGDNADNRVLDALSCFTDKFHYEAVSDDELSFLIQHFQDVVFYEFSDVYNWVATSSTSILWSRPISENRFTKLKEYFSLPDKGTVYVADADICDNAVSFLGYVVKGYTGGINRMNSVKFRHVTWALGQIRLFALNIHSEIEPFGAEALDENNIPEPSSVDLVIFDPIFQLQDGFEIEKLYDLLKNDGKMFVSSNYHDLIKEDNILTRFLSHMAEKKRVSAIISLRDEFVDGSYSVNVLFCLTKEEQPEILVESGSYHTSINVSKIDPTFLWPEYYLVERPNDGVSLSSIVRLYNTSQEMMKHPRSEYDVESNKRKRINEDYLSDEMLLAGGPALSENYANANLCSKQLIPVNDKRFDQYIDGFDVLDTWRDRLCKVYEPGVTFHVVGDSLFVGYINENPKNKYVVFEQQAYLIPKRGIDVRYIASVLLSQEVRDQVILLSRFGSDYQTLSFVLDRIIVPKRNPKERFQFLAEVNYGALMSTQQELKKNHEDYKKAVRMRKHALTQSLSSIEAMFYALDAYRLRQNGNLSDADIISRRKGTTVKEAFEFIEPNLKNMMVTLEHIADVEYSFDNPQMIDPERFIEAYVAQKESGWLNFKPIINWKKGNNQFGNDVRDPETGSMIAHADDPISVLYFSKDAFKLVLDNVVANAIAHGFTDSNRNDYKLRFSWHTNGMNLVVVVENNGTAIPADRDTASLLEYGVSGALHHDGHNGIGCNEIDDIMRRYDGKVEIVSTPDEEYTVKYILTFKSNSNSINAKLLGL